MSLLINKICISDSLAAKVAADSFFPFVVSGGTPTSVPQIVSLNTSSINTATGLYTYTARNQLGTTLSTNSTIQFTPCNDADLTFTTSNMLYGIGLVFAFLIAFGIGMTR